MGEMGRYLVMREIPVSSFTPEYKVHGLYVCPSARLDSVRPYNRDFMSMENLIILEKKLNTYKTPYHRTFLVTRISTL